MMRGEVVVLIDVVAVIVVVLATHSPVAAAASDDSVGVERRGEVGQGGGVGQQMPRGVGGGRCCESA